MTRLVTRGSHRGFFAVIGFSGILEVTALAWWSSGLLRIMFWRQSVREEASPRPSRIEAGHRVSDVLEWYPTLVDVLVNQGFAPLAQPLLRKTLARGVTLGQAAALRGVDPRGLVDSLNHAVEDRGR